MPMNYDRSKLFTGAVIRGKSWTIVGLIEVWTEEMVATQVSKRLPKPFQRYILTSLEAPSSLVGLPDFQIRCGGVKAFPGGFDSHALPP